jgi:Putative Flp pilus-assembly TadE/G-like
MFERPSASDRGQVIVLFAFALLVMVLMVGLVVDAGYAFAQRRGSQNAADFAAMAGSRIVGEYFTGQPAGAGTDANVDSAIRAALSSNRAELVNAQYVNAAGVINGTVGAGTIPSSAAGVVVDADISWRPFLLGLIGINDWSAGSRATAMTKGIAAGGVLPIGINGDRFLDMPLCDAAAGCSVDLEPGTIIQPGQFGWLSFGADPHGCDAAPGYGLGMLPEGCANNQGFLQNQIGPPGDSHGCCTSILLTPDPDRNIKGLTGNEWGDLSWYIDNQVPVWVPIWDTSHGTGSNAYYHIIGFAAILLTGEDGSPHAKWLEGVRLTDIGDTPNAFSLIGVTGEVYLVR